MIPGAAASSTIQQLLANVPTVQNVTAAVTAFMQNATSSLAAANSAATNGAAANVTAANATAANLTAAVTADVVQKILPILTAGNATAANITSSIATILAEAVGNLTSLFGTNTLSVNATVSSG